MFEGEHLYRVICGQGCTDAVGAVDGFGAPRALDEVHFGRPRLQPLGAVQVEGEPRRIGYLDQAVGLMGQQLELLCKHVPERPERMLEPARPRLGGVRLDRGQQVGRIEARGKRAPPRVDDRRPQSRGRFRWEFGAERALGEQTLPAPLNLPGAREQIGPRFDCQPLGRHGPVMISVSTGADLPAERPSLWAGQLATRILR